MTWSTSRNQASRPTSLQQFISALISAGGCNYGTAKSYDSSSKFDPKEPSGMIIGEVSTEQTTENTQTFDAMPNSGAERDPGED